jgi:hypothetical protein
MSEGKENDENRRKVGILLGIFIPIAIVIIIAIIYSITNIL